MVEKKFKYGIYEARIKVPNNRACFSAFWLFSSSSTSDEIDIYEQLDESKYKVDLKTTIHYNHDNIGDKNLYKRAFLNDWHTFTLMWDNMDIEHAKIKSHIDGSCVSVFKKNNQNNVYNTCIGNIFGNTVGYPRNAMSIILNLTIHNDKQIYEPIEMIVDYVKIWQKQNCSEDITICNYNAELDNNVITGKTITTNKNCSISINNDQFIDLYATDKIVINGGFKINPGGNFSAKIIPCSTGQKEDILPSETENDSLLACMSYYPDTTENDDLDTLKSFFNNNDSTVYKFLLIENKTKVFYYIYDISGKLLYQCNNKDEYKSYFNNLSSAFYVIRTYNYKLKNFHYEKIIKY